MRQIFSVAVMIYVYILIHEITGILKLLHVFVSVVCTLKRRMNI